MKTPITILWILILPIFGFAQTKILDAATAATKVGEEVAFEGKVVSVYHAWDKEGEPTFLNIDLPFPKNPIVLVLFDSHRLKFPNIRDTYEGKRVSVQGKVELYLANKYKENYKPKINLISPEQIQVLDE